MHTLTLKQIHTLKEEKAVEFKTTLTKKKTNKLYNISTIHTQTLATIQRKTTKNFITYQRQIGEIKMYLLGRTGHTQKKRKKYNPYKKSSTKE